MPKRMIYCLLLLAEVIITIGLGILGNKLSEMIIITPFSLSVSIL